MKNFIQYQESSNPSMIPPLVTPIHPAPPILLPSHLHVIRHARSGDGPHPSHHLSLTWPLDSRSRRRKQSPRHELRARRRRHGDDLSPTVLIDSRSLAHAWGRYVRRRWCRPMCVRLMVGVPIDLPPMKRDRIVLHSSSCR